MNKRYEILEGLPTYGSMYISVTENGTPFYSEGFAVKFFKTDGTQWVANFQPGWTKLKDVLELQNTSNLLVIAGGLCYIMNPDETRPISVFGVNYYDILKADNGRFILQDTTCLTIIESDGNYWDSERISWDGFKKLRFENGIVLGLSSDFGPPPSYDKEQWVEFSYDTNSKILVGGSYPHYENQKPWWKIKYYLRLARIRFAELLKSR